MITAKKAMTNETKSTFTSHLRIATKTNFLLLLCTAGFGHARYSSRIIDRFLNWDNHGNPKSGKNEGRCQRPPVGPLVLHMSRFPTLITLRDASRKLNGLLLVNKDPAMYVPVGCIGLWKHNGVLSEFGTIREIGKMCHVMSIDE